MIEQHSYSGDYTNSYKFNGKELDEETGFYYYGARYYNPKFSIWLSVDPLVEKTKEPYSFCYNNPLRFVDPDGRQGEDWVKHNGLMTWDSNVKNQKDAVRYYGKDAKYYAPNAYGAYDKKGDYTLYSDYGKFVKNGVEYQAPDRAVNTNAKKEAYKKAETANKAASAISAGSGVKDVLMEGAVAQSSNTKIYNVTEDIVSATSGAGVAKYLKYSKGASVALGVLGTAYSANEARIQYQAGGLSEVMQHRDGLDATVGAVGLGATALTTLGVISNPVGWGIGIGCLVYGGGCLIYEAVTEDKK